jgi:hypothetical protein
LPTAGSACSSSTPRAPRGIQIRGDAELVHRGAIDHLDALTRDYTSHPCFYGHVYPKEQRRRETRVTVRLHAHRITLDAIHP